MELAGQPTAAAEPIADLMWSYKDWLHYEHRMASYELANYDLALGRSIERMSLGDVSGWHFQWSREGMRGPAGWIDAPQPSTRAALVLGAVGLDWREAA